MRRKRMVLLMGAGMFFCFLVLQFQAMFFHGGDGILRYTTRFVLPPAWVHGRPISYHRVVETAHAFVALHVAPTYQEAFPLALEFVIQDFRLKDLIDEQILVSEEVLTEQDISALAHAHISSSEQERYVILPLLRMRASESLRSTLLPSQEIRLQNVLEKIDLGMPFSDIAQYFSEDSSAMNGGDLGVFLLSELPSWAQETATMKVGEVRSNFVGEDAFWVLKVVDAGGDADTAWVRIRGIAINKPTLGALLRAHADMYPAWVFVW